MSGKGALRANIVVPFVIVTLIWGSTWLVIKDQVSTVPATWTIVYRFAVSCVGMFAMVKLRGLSLRLSGEGMRLAALVGVLQFCGNFQFVYRAEMRLTSGVVAVLYALLLVPNALLARVFLKQPVSGRFLAGSLVAIGGIALLLLHEYRYAALHGGGVIVGIALTLTGLLCASSANVLQTTARGRRQETMVLLAWAMLFGTIVDVVLALIVAGAPSFDARPGFAAGVLYLAVFGTVITFPLYFGLIRNIGPGPAAYSGVAVPVVAMALSTLLEGYRWTPLAAGGAVLALVGLVIALTRRQARVMAAPAIPPEM